jgi:hypothetical protein
MKSYGNNHQQAWANYVAALPPEQRCDCGREMKGQCFGRCFGDRAKGGALQPAQKRDNLTRSGS